MADAARDVVTRHLEVALGERVDLDAVPDDASLESLGLDSLLVVSALVGISDECGVDLVDHMDDLATPRAVGDLLTITAEFMARRPAP